MMSACILFIVILLLTNALAIPDEVRHNVKHEVKDQEKKDIRNEGGQKVEQLKQRYGYEESLGADLADGNWGSGSNQGQKYGKYQENKFRGSEQGKEFKGVLDQTVLDSINEVFGGSSGEIVGGNNYVGRKGNERRPSYESSSREEHVGGFGDNVESTSGELENSYGRGNGGEFGASTGQEFASDGFEGGFREQPGNGFRDSYGDVYAREQEGGFRQQPGGGFRRIQGSEFFRRPGGGFRRPLGGFRRHPGRGYPGEFREAPPGAFGGDPGNGFGGRPVGGFGGHPGGEFRGGPEGGFGGSPGSGFRDGPGGGFRDSSGGGYRDDPGGRLRDGPPEGIYRGDPGVGFEYYEDPGEFGEPPGEFWETPGGGIPEPRFGKRPGDEFLGDQKNSSAEQVQRGKGDDFGKQDKVIGGKLEGDRETEKSRSKGNQAKVFDGRQKGAYKENGGKEKGLEMAQNSGKEGPVLFTSSD